VTVIAATVIIFEWWCTKYAQYGSEERAVGLDNANDDDDIEGRK
jgi:hypothetical protein